MAGPPALPPPDTAAAAAASSSASSPRYQEWILDTIDSLRSRKARPDLERICRMVRRRHGPEPERTRAELEKLIQQRAVLRVSYKGSISYRNAARVQPPRRGATPPVPPRGPRGAAAAAAAPPPPPPAPPAPVASPPRAPRAAAATAPPSPGAPAPSPPPRAQRAAPLPPPPPPAGAPSPGPRRAPPPAGAAAREPAPPSPLPLPLPPEGGASRSGPARPVSLREVVRYLGGSGGGGGRLTRGRVQGLLLEEEAAAARGRLERTRIASLALPRNDRSGRAPPATSSRAARTKKSGEESLREEEDEEDEEEVSALSEGSEVPEGEGAHGGQNQYNGETGHRESGKERPREWSSSIAPGRQDEGHRSALADGTREAFPMGVVKMEGGSASAATGPDSPSPVPLPPGKPALPSADGTPFGCSSGRKEKPSDPVEWTVMDVVEYFTEAGFPEQASAFQEQEIDGKSLLLMQRTDVLTGLSIRLGPALKIYEHHIKVLQQGHFEDDDPDGFLG
ncbi:atherin [Sarcophilus harrisii]|uniref:Sterile alpha motif domain containing 1 n=1 Tax=Sarcophilus harrisii TaxID=9305 RepID=A0A7N4PVQ5_SARHA|nr:atherin [Sarcophilus harrisii]